YRPLRIDAVRNPVAGDEGDRSLDGAAGSQARGGVESREEKLGLAVAGESGEAHDLALARDELAAVRLPLRRHAHPDRRLPAPADARRGEKRGFAHDAAHRGDQLRTVEIARAVFRHHLAVPHDDDAVAG